MIKKNKALIVKDPNCLNCGYPFNGYESFCPSCGQENKGSRITFLSFMAEMFRGFFSWDAKFWRTLFPLLTNPGKVSLDYVSGKRERYSNPFRFYLTVSVLFFLLLSMYETYKKINDLNAAVNSKVENTSSVKNTEALEINKDSITTAILSEIDEKQHLINDVNSKDAVMIGLKKSDTDSIAKDNKIAINSTHKFFDSFLQFSKLNPDLKIDEALDSLKLPTNFSNRFWYSRALLANKIAKDDTERKKFLQQMVSLGSISLFILLPLFTLSLKFIYLRRRFTYVEHLIFVFHTQTVFFLLLTIFFIITITTSAEYDDVSLVFFCLFALYLYLAMKKFYKQGYFKTFFKFCLTNFFFVTLTSIGVLAILAIVFALY